VISLITTRGTAQQIAARLTADLRESEHRYRQMFEQNHVIKLLIDPISGQILKANPAAARFYGYSIEKLQQLSLNDITPADLSETAMASEMVLTEKTSGSNSYHRLASGEVRQVKMYSSPLHLNGHRVLYSIIHDITDRKLAEERLTASEIRYRRLFETAKDGVLILDADTGRIVDVNPFLIELLGYTTEQFLEKEIWEIGIFKGIVAKTAL
jgi:PAS domain S-box-containing protein